MIFSLFRIIKNITFPKRHYSITLSNLFLDLSKEDKQFSAQNNSTSTELDTNERKRMT
jgi:hypothetical protein